MNARYLQPLAALFVTTLIISNIIASKIGSFGGFFMPVGVVIFPLAYVLGDVLTEVYGYGVMRRVIWTGFLCNLLAVLILWVARVLPPAPFYADQAAFDAVLGSTPRILAASFVAYLIGSFSNALIMAKLKVKTQGRFLWLRMITSTIVGEGLDSFVFILLAFGGVFPGGQVVMLAVTQWVFKLAFEVVVVPVSYAVVAWLKRAEKTDHYDRATNFNPLHF